MQESLERANKHIKVAMKLLAELKRQRALRGHCHNLGVGKYATPKWLVENGFLCRGRVYNSGVGKYKVFSLIDGAGNV